MLGGTAESVQHALLVRQWSSDLVYFPHTFPVTEADREQLAARGISIIEGHVGRLVLKDDRLRGVELDDGFIVSRTAVFVRPRFVPHSDLLVALGCAVNGDGWVEADPTGHTSVAGVWVAGNAVNPRAQVITAAGEGSATAIAINADLVGEDTGEAVSAFGRASKS